MTSKVLIISFAAVLALSVVTSQAAPGGWGAGGVNPWMPPWLATAPWLPGNWSPCLTIGSDCLDCNTKVVCTKVGGFQKPCTDPTKPYCNLGTCSATPTTECAPTTEAVTPV